MRFLDRQKGNRSELIAPVILAAVRVETPSDLRTGYHQLRHSFHTGPVRTVITTSVLVIANNFVIHPEPEVIAAAFCSAPLVKHYFDAAGPRKADVDIIVLAVFVRML